MRKRKNTGLRCVRYGSLGLFGLVMLGILFPVAPIEIHASCVDGTETEDCAKSYARADINMTTNTVIALTLENAVNMDITPKANGATAMGIARLGVSTNSNDGYGIYLKTGNADGALKPTTSNQIGEIRNTEKNATLRELEPNSYGYALTSALADDNTVYRGIPIDGGIIKSTDNVTVSNGEYAYGDEYYLTFGTKIDTSLSAGTYSGSVVLSVVANPTTLRSLYDLTYMQEVTPELCEATGEHYTKQLIDTRDGKTYWVAKLKDGNCWMTQNLALDLVLDDEGNAAALAENGTKTTLDETNSDMKGKWGKDATYPPTRTNSWALNGVQNGLNLRTLSWNIGKIVLATPDYGKLCGGRDDVSGSDKSAMSTDNIAEVCGNSGFIEITDEWKPTFVARQGSYTMPDGTIYNGLVTVDVTGKAYDAHYLVGNYYQGKTVVVGGPAEIAGEINSESSICPKGWRMPTSMAGSFENNVKGSFAYLFKSYGLATSDAIGPISGQYNVVENPIYLVRAGTASAYSGYLIGMGRNVYLYSGTIVSDAMTQALNYVYAGNSNGWVVDFYVKTYNNGGHSVRCIAG